MIDLILLGAGGHCKSTIEVLETMQDVYCLKGILDFESKGELCGYPILGNDDLIESFAKENQFLITVGSIKSTKIRKKIAEKVSAVGGLFATVISKNAVVSKRSVIGKGTVILHNATVNADVVIGEQCIINTAANIEHDCKIGDFVHVSTGAMINGGCQIGNRCFVGSNSTIAQGVTVCNDVIIGAGSVVIKDIMEPGTYVGNPAKKMEIKMKIEKKIAGGYTSIVYSPFERRIA